MTFKNRIKYMIFLMKRFIVKILPFKYKLYVAKKSLLSGKIGKSKIWDYLGVPSQIDIPELGELGKAPQKYETWIYQRAQLEIWNLTKDGYLHANAVKKEGDMWIVEIVRCGIGEREWKNVGEIILNNDGKVMSYYPITT